MMYAEILCIAVLNMNMPNAQYACEQMEHVVNAAEDVGIPAHILVALIRYESNWSPKAKGKSGECGLTQVLPRYTRYPKHTCKQLLDDPIVSIYAGAKVLRQWIDKHGNGRIAKGLCGYNYGFRCGRSYGKKHRGWRYSRKIMKYSKRIKRQIYKITKDGC